MLAAAASALALGSLPSRRAGLATTRSRSSRTASIWSTTRPGRCGPSAGSAPARCASIVNWCSVAPDPLARTSPSSRPPTPAAYPAGGWARFDDDRQGRQEIRPPGRFHRLLGGSRVGRGQAHPHHLLTHTDRGVAAVGQGTSASSCAAVGTPLRRQVPGSRPIRARRLPRVSFWSDLQRAQLRRGPRPAGDRRLLRSGVAPMMYRQSGHGGLERAAGDRRTPTTRSSSAGSPRAGSEHSRASATPAGPARRLRPDASRSMFVRHAVLRRQQPTPRAGQRRPGRSAARPRGSGSRRFRSREPGPVPGQRLRRCTPIRRTCRRPRTARTIPTTSRFNKLPKEERTLDRIMHDYGSGKRFPIYNDEYGYITHPPNPGPYVSPATAALLHQLGRVPELAQPPHRLATMQYLLYDPTPKLQRLRQRDPVLQRQAQGRPTTPTGCRFYLPHTSMGRGRQGRGLGMRAPRDLHGQGHGHVDRRFRSSSSAGRADRSRRSRPSGSPARGDTSTCA